MKIKRYQQFIKENVNSEIDFNEILNMPLEQRKEIQSGIEGILDVKKNESFNINEATLRRDIMGEIEEFADENLPKIAQGVMNVYKNAISKLKKWIGKKAMTFLINQSEKELNEKIDVLRMLDPTDLSDIGPVESIYLGGGIDKTSGEGATGWRDMVEEYFGMDHVFRGEEMNKLAKEGKFITKGYAKPMIMNPMRNELVRTNDPRFSEIFRKWKAGELNTQKDHEDWKYWANAINKEIHAPDLRIVNACDTNLVKLDPAAGAGTLGEMQVSTLRGLNLFVWLDNGYQVQDISPWLIPTISKLVRNDEELRILLDGIKNKNR